MRVTPCVVVALALFPWVGCSQPAPPQCEGQAASDELFPLAAGARWEFEEVALDNSSQTKFWRIEDVNDGTFQFHQWGTKDRTTWVHQDDRGAVWWTRRTTFSDEARKAPTEDLHYGGKGRLRFDPDRTDVGDTWQVTVTVKELNPGAADCPEWTEETADPEVTCPELWDAYTVTDTWEVIEVPDTEALDEYEGLVCHRRVETIGGDSDSKQYCFAPGLGKVWEYDVSIKHEVLVDACIPD